MNNHQSLDKIQRAVAFCTNLNHAEVTAKCRRIGGAFGGKATRTPWVACAAAISSKMIGLVRKISEFQL